MTGLILAIVSGVIAYRVSGPYGRRLEENLVQRVLSDETGELQLIIYDSSGDLMLDTWSYMNGDRVVRRERDTDDDGRVDRWEHYRPDLTRERIEQDTDGDGRPNYRGTFPMNKKPTTSDITTEARQ